MNRRKRKSFKYDDPTIAGGVGGELLNGQRDKSQFDFRRRWRAGLRWLARHVERGDDATDVDSRSQIFVPVRECLVFTTLQRQTQFFALAVE